MFTMKAYFIHKNSRSKSKLDKWHLIGQNQRSINTHVGGKIIIILTQQNVFTLYYHIKLQIYSASFGITINLSSDILNFFYLNLYHVINTITLGFSIKKIIQNWWIIEDFIKRFLMILTLCNNIEWTVMSPTSLSSDVSQTRLWTNKTTSKFLENSALKHDGSY